MKTSKRNKPAKKANENKKARIFLKNNKNKLFRHVELSKREMLQAGIKLGDKLNDLVEEPNRAGMNFMGYLEKKVPMLFSDAQKWMEMANHVDLRRFPKLIILDEGLIQSLISLSDGEQVRDYLRKNNICIDIDEFDFFEVLDLRKDVQDLIESKSIISESSEKKEV